MIRGSHYGAYLLPSLSGQFGRQWPKVTFVMAQPASAAETEQTFRANVHEVRNSITGMSGALLGRRVAAPARHELIEFAFREIRDRRIFEIIPIPNKY